MSASSLLQTVRGQVLQTHPNWPGLLIRTLAIHSVVN